jgi:trans-aconitate 2-methyltransferase
VVDLGCGPGNLTELLCDRWPDAAVEGVDSSPDMIAEASARGGRARYRVGDVASWRPDADVVVANAVLQWVPTHRDLLRVWAAALPAGGWLAFQVPGNFGAPSHALMREVAASPRWAPLVGGVLRHTDAVDDPTGYAELLLDAGLAVDAWETTYLHRLPGPDPVLEWVRGTGLRPILAALSPADAAAFEADYGARLREAYPATAHGTFLEFRRVFAVARKA